MSSTLRNGTPSVRKSLAEQIDRLDKTLDGLADNLNDAVASAVKDAVQNVLVEVLTNPQFANLLRNAAGPSPDENDKSNGSGGLPPSTPSKKGFFGGLWDRTCKSARAISRGVAHGMQKVVQTCSAGLQMAASGLVWLWNGAKAVATGVAKGVAVVVGAAVLGAVTRARTTFGFVRALATASFA